MHDRADELLYALSAWGETSWPKFVRAFDEILSSSPGDAGPVAVERWRALTGLSFLAHIDVVPGERDVVVAPAVIAQLPVPGLVRGVLCGRRSQATLSELKQEAKSLGGAVRVVGSKQAPSGGFSPMRIEVSAIDSDGITELANRLGIAYVDTPPAWGLAEVSGSVDEYLEQLQWSEEADLNWERTDFDPSSVRMGAPRPSDGELRLSRYRNPSTGQALVRLWNGSQTASADADWGRFAVLRAAGKTVVEYDFDRLCVDVAWGAPLPTLLGRALALCSGRSPTSVSRRDGNGRSGGYLRYGGVPPDVARKVISKLGQG